ncbi:FxsB family radical SAM/SPASM domain protein [Streptomyces sp. NBC_00440]|uniref:FxsB family cyclophane-forming radical SAM/SPASM peptide maturase n=1 Tax=unclassified Streptomyces TaxID=2593676 RepID=UPI00224D1587|nr:MULTISPECIES: FxsB family cyclophane-forming radical SAM/SPASM peptide maturase [unclassified Streptomyces]MCX4723802.1 FxsB family radical SAM/SPASM domain protein [Streptomyces sp. NBC_01306]
MTPAVRDRPVAQHPVPFRQFVLKVHSRCNLGCSYCYVYRGQDSSWRERPRRATGETVRRTAARIAEHVTAHRLPRIRIELHGGEPLLSGPGPVIEYARAVRDAVPAGCEVTATVQTNGTLLTARTLDALAAARIRVGLSLDGGTAALNSRRRDHAGRPSWPAAHRAARLLAACRHPGTYAGILCTIDLAADPVEVYDSLRALRPPGLDLLLPHGNWSVPPPGTEPGEPGRHRPRPTPYGHWLATVFDRWWDGGPGQPRIRLFHTLVALLFGEPAAAEAVGLAPLAVVVVDTDGAIEQVDALKSAYEGAPSTGLDVFSDPFDTALAHPGIAARQLGEKALPGVCLRCPVLRVCGGGNYVHRYAAGAGFRHPSVYCADLEYLIRYIAHRLSAFVT